jgi:SMI1 / KNR4 family (SUKH-1)
MPFPVDIQLVKRAEDKLGRKLPLGYVGKMCQHNGGEVECGSDSWNLHPIFDDSDKKRLKRTCNDIVRETKVARELTPDFPPSALVIGANGGGDLLVFVADSGSDHYGDSVYLWSHETGELNKVADDFAELASED